MALSNLLARQLDIHNVEHIKTIINEVDTEQNRSRKRAAWKAFQCRSDNQLEYVKKELQKLYPQTHKKFRVGNIKICKKVVEKIAKSYKQNPMRKVEENEVATEALNEIYNKFNFHRAFKEADEIFTLHKYVCMWLGFQNPSEAADKHVIKLEEGQYVLNALAPYEYDLIRDQVSGEPLVFILGYPDSTITELAGRSDGIEQLISESQSDTSAEGTTYLIWSPDKFAEVKIKKQKNSEGSDEMLVDFLKEDTNLLGRLPIEYLQLDTAVDYPVPSDIAESSIAWNTSFSDLKTASSTQGHGQLVIKHPEGQEMKQVHMGMHTAISLPQSKKQDAKPTEADYISASPDLSGQLEVLKFDIMNILDDEGIKAKGAIDGGVQDFASGFDRLLSEADVQDIIEDNQSLYVPSLEAGVFDILKAHENVMSEKTFKEEDRIITHFEKPKVLISDKETLDNIEKRIELGTLMQFEKHMILNPNLTEEQAKEREAEIQEEVKAKENEEREAVVSMMKEEANINGGDDDDNEDDKE